MDLTLEPEVQRHLVFDRRYRAKAGGPYDQAASAYMKHLRDQPAGRRMVGSARPGAGSVLPVWRSLGFQG
jgi:hypothetical protein